MGRSIAGADALADARRVLEKRDAKGFAKIADALGIELKLAPYARYVEQHAKSQWADLSDACGTAGLQLLFTALTSEHGHAMQVVYGQTILVAKTADGKRVVFAMQDGAESKPFKKWGWKIEPRWYKDPAKNRPTIENWLADPVRAKDALTIPITRAFEMPAVDATGAALLAAVCADPDDVGARLVYADWLVEQGDSRGELIRVQCDLASATGKQREALEERSEALLKAYTTTMVEPIKRFVERAKIHRGLIEEIEIFGDQLVKHGAAIVAEHPISTLHVCVKDAEQFAKLAALPWIGNVAHVTYEGRSEKRVINSGAKLQPSAAIGTAMFAKTRSLDFEYVEDTPKQWAKFYAGVSAPMLGTLRVSNLDEEGLTALGKSKGLPKLRELALEHLAPSGRKAKPLAALAAHALEAVTLRFMDFDKLGPCVGALLSPTVRAVKLYRLDGSGVAAALADRGQHLEKLTLDSVDITLDAIAELLVKRKLPKLKQLAVVGIEGDEDACEAFTVALCAAPKTLSWVSWGPNMQGGGSNPSEDLVARIKGSGRACV